MAFSRLDHELVSRNLVDSRELGKRLILAGKVTVNGHVIDKASNKVKNDDVIKIKEAPKYVSRGGFKLEEALKAFKIDPSGLICLDIGASTGGFSHVLLNNGAKRIYSVDVGYGQLHEKLLSNKNVISLERTNARYLTPEDIPDNIDILVCDVSFISLKKVLPEPIKLLSRRADLICLIKPQFEVGKKNISKGGIVRDLQIREDCCKDLKAWFETILGFKVLNIIESPIKGPKGNTEYLIHVKK